MNNSVTGDWDEILKLCKNFSKDFKEGSSDYIKEQSEMVKATVQRRIRNGEDMTPLKPNTIKKKGSSDILVETGTLADSISIERDSTSFVVGPTGDNPSGLSNEQQAIYHEFGTERIPPRPFMRPSFEEVESKLKDEIVEVVSNIINKYT